MQVSLAKADGMRWWPAVVKGQPEINLQKARSADVQDCARQYHAMHPQPTSISAGPVPSRASMPLSRQFAHVTV